MSFDYSSQNIINDNLMATVDSEDETELKISLRNGGLEPSYGVALEISSTILLANLASECEESAGKENEV